MRIALVSDSRDIHTLKLVRYLSAKGHEIHLLSFFDSRDYTSLPGVKLHLLPKGLLQEGSWIANLARTTLRKVNLGYTAFNPLLAVIRMKAILNEISPDVLHGQSIVGHTILAAATGFHPLVVTSMGSDILIYTRNSTLARYAIRYVLSKADAVTAHGENLRSEIVRFGVDPGKVFSIISGVDLSDFSPESKDRRIRDSYDIPDGPIVISTRRMSPVHDVETLVRAVPLVAKAIPNVTFLLVGDGETRRVLQDVATKLGVQDIIRFVGNVPHGELSRYLASSDIYVSTSISDGLSVSTMEAMACGLPLVVTDVGDNHLWIKNEENGYLIPIKNPEALAERVTYLAQNSNVRARLGVGNRRLAEEKADLETNMNESFEVYERAIARCGR